MHVVTALVAIVAVVFLIVAVHRRVELGRARVCAPTPSVMLACAFGLVVAAAASVGAFWFTPPLTAVQCCRESVRPRSRASWSKARLRYSYDRPGNVVASCTSHPCPIASCGALALARACYARYPPRDHNGSVAVRKTDCSMNGKGAAQS